MTTYRITKENAKAFDYPDDSTSVHFWISKDVAVFLDNERQPQGEFVPVIIRTEYPVWVSKAVLEEVTAAS